jgi:threonine-phosphate decarboxylase
MAMRSDHVVVLRSLTKFYGMPALRVGYSVSTPEMAARIDAQLPAWPVTTLAAAAAAEALRDDDYARRTLRAVADDRRQLRDRLASRAIETYASAANFLLIRLPEGGVDSPRLRTQLIHTHRIVVRDCRSFDGMADGRFIRVAVRAHADNERLVEAIRSVLQERRRAD